MFQKTSDEFGLTDRLNFHTQDLSCPDFQIPEADIDYLYDPFTEETYQYVLKQIVEWSQKRSEPSSRREVQERSFLK